MPIVSYPYFSTLQKYCKFRTKLKKTLADKKKSSTFAVPNRGTLRYGVMVALQILALSVRVRVLLSQLKSAVYADLFFDKDGGVAQLVRASDS